MSFSILFYVLCVLMIFSKVMIWPSIGGCVAHSVNHMFSLVCLFAFLIVSYVGFEDGLLVLTAQVPGQPFLSLLRTQEFTGTCY